MKRIISLILIAFMLLSLFVACDDVTKIDMGDDDDDDTQKSSDTASGTGDNFLNLPESETAPGNSDTAPGDSTDGGNNNGNTNGGNNNGNTNSGNNGAITDTNNNGQNQFGSAIDVNAHDYDGLEIVVLMRDDVNYFREWGKQDGDAADVEVTLDEAIETRNYVVGSDLNLLPVYIRGKHNETEFNNLIVNDVIGGLHFYDIVANYAYYASDTAIRDADAYANLADKDLFPYFDFSLPCWNQAIVQNTTLNGKLYMVAGDANLSLFDKTTVIWANLDLYNQYRTNSDPADIQQHAIDGNWTFSDLYSWCLRSADTDPRTACGDFHGFSTGFGFFDTLPYAWDFELITTNNAGRHSFNIENNTKAEDALGIIRSILDSSGYAPMHHQDGTKNICKCGSGIVGHFADGSYAFIGAQLYNGEAQNMRIRTMVDKYTILPIPKYEASQESYGTTALDVYNLVAVINHVDNSDCPTNGRAISAYLQYLNEKSYTDVRELYFARTVQAKFFASEDDAEIVVKSIKLFNMIMDSVEFDVYNIYSHSINDISWLWRNSIILGEDASLSDDFYENSYSGTLKTKAQYEQMLAAFDAWIFDE